MSILDYFLGSEEERRQREEKQRIADLGQDVPEVDAHGDPITYESPETPMDKPEREQAFPTGIPEPAHRGALAELAAKSAADEQRVDAPSERPSKTGSSAGDVIGGAGAGSPSSRVWYTTDQTAIEKAKTEAKEAQGYGKIGFGVGTVVRLAASMGAGAGAGAAAGGMGGGGAAAGGMGAAGAGGVAGGAATAGTAAGASSAAGGAAGASTAGSVSTVGTSGGASSGGTFGGDFMSAFKGQGGGSNGYGSMLGKLARNQLQKQMTSGGGGGGGSSSGVGAGKYGGPVFEGMEGQPDALTAESKGKNNQSLHSFINMLGGGADAEKQYARMVLEDQTDELVPGRIPWG